MAFVYRDVKARSRAMVVVLSGTAAGALGKSLQQQLVNTTSTEHRPPHPDLRRPVQKRDINQSVTIDGI